MKRFHDFFSENGSNNPKIRLMMESDYEGIFDYVVDQMSQLGFKHRCMKLLLRIINLF